MAVLNKGNFVRVKSDSDARPGQDGMVVSEDDGSVVGLVFGWDRFNRSPEALGVTRTGLVEEWPLIELDLTSIAA